MTSVSNVSYQPAAAYQGSPAEAHAEPRTGQTQPREAPAADTQRGDQHVTREEGKTASERGGRVDVKA